MEALIRSMDLYNATKKTGIHFWMERQKERAEGKPTPDIKDLKGALWALKDGTSRVDFPGNKSEAGVVCEDILKEIISHVSELDPDGQGEKGTDTFYPDCIKFILAMLEVGPGSTHLELIECIRGRCEGFRRYYPAQSMEEVRKVIAVLQREFITKEPRFKHKHYFHQLVLAYHTLVDKKRHPRAINTGHALPQTTYNSLQEEFLDLYMFHETSFLSRDSDVMERQRYLSMMIGSKYDNGIFNGLRKPEVFRRHLHTLDGIIKDSDFPKTTEALQIALDRLRDLLTGIIKDRLVSELAEDVHRTLETIIHKKQRETQELAKIVGSFYTAVTDQENITALKGKKGLFEYLAPGISALLDDETNRTFLDFEDFPVIKPAVCNVMCACMNSSKEHLTLLLKLLKSLVKTKHTACIDTAQQVLTDKEAFVKWKSHVHDAKEVLDIVFKREITGDAGDKEKQSLADHYRNLMSYLLAQTKRDRVTKDLNDQLVRYSTKCLTTRSVFMFQLGAEVVSKVEFNIRKEKALIFHSLEAMTPLLGDQTFPWQLKTTRIIAETLATEAMDAIVDHKVLEQKEIKSIVKLAETVMKGEFINHESNVPDTVFFSLYAIVGNRLMKMIDDEEKVKMTSQLMTSIISLIDSEYNEIQSLSVSHISTVSSRTPGALAAHMERLVDVYVAEEFNPLLCPISRAHTYNTGPVEKHFETFFDLIDSRDDDVRDTVLPLLRDVANCQPKVYNKDQVSKVIDELTLSSGQNQVPYLQILLPLSKQRSDVVACHVVQLMAADVDTSGQPAFCDVLMHVAMNSDKKKAEPVIAYFNKRLEEKDDPELSPLILNKMRSIGAVHRELLETRKPLIAKLSKSSKVQEVRDICTFMLDVLEGRSLEALGEDVSGMKQEVGQIGQEVASTKVKVENVEKDATEQRKRVDKVEVKVNYQGRELRELEGTVEATVEKVDEIDKKTLSHTPFWARDVSKLLNPEDKRDWRLLAKRLGYSNDDVRRWAQTPDPCQSMLNEWYSNHKTREATHGVLQALNDMDRTDAASIVENAMKMADTVVEDEPFEYKRPPSVFLSYQWGKQTEVQLLQRHLESAGYSCWLDIGQMGGGDKLFEKIDQGIRSAQVVLCCVTDKYAKSPNCNREVNLAVNVGKPMIPLIFEKSTWPPAGSMGPIFSEYLFVRLFSRPGEVCRKGLFWPEAKFREVLMQLVYNKVETTLPVKPDYKNWWQVAGHSSTGQHKKSSPEKKSEPEVFLSYQWGKQPEVQKLYTRLTCLGMTCWMDIHQMGGGDSLFDKIDKGIRASKVVVSCVTGKYSLSTNCRREVALADALKKPIVPILLEETTWPPSGPMSMVFASLQYIDFSKDSRVQESWKGGQADKLIESIRCHVRQTGQSQSSPAGNDEKGNKPAANEDKTNTQSQKVQSGPKSDKKDGNNSRTCTII